MLHQVDHYVGIKGVIKIKIIQKTISFIIKKVSNMLSQIDN